MRRLFDWILLLAVLGFGGYLAYTHQAQVTHLVRMAQYKVAPCSTPITYSAIAIDPRFHIATSTVITDLAKAGAIWDKAGGKTFFQYEPSGGEVSVRLIYDERQAATDKLSSLGISIDSSEATYHALQARYDALKATVESERATYDADVAAYKQAQDAYNAEVQHWNSQGGAPRAEYDKLNAERQSLASQFAGIKAEEQTMNDNIDTLNALATTINQLIVQLNLNVSQYNQTGTAGGQFEEGLYEEKGGIETITIYEYQDHTQLVRVMAHEMGHALGLEHVSDKQAIMYKVNGGENLAATAADVAELNRVCRLQ